MRAILCLVLTTYQLVLLIHVVLSWVPRPPEPILPLVRGVRRIVEPVLTPIRRYVKPARVGSVALDLSIIIVFLGIYIIQLAVC